MERRSSAAHWSAIGMSTILRLPPAGAFRSRREKVGVKAGSKRALFRLTKAKNVRLICCSSISMTIMPLIDFWLFCWKELIAARRFKAHKVRGMHRSYVFRLAERRDAPNIVYPRSSISGFSETNHLLKSPCNAERLRAAVQELDSGRGKERKLVECSSSSPSRLGPIISIGRHRIKRLSNASICSSKSALARPLKGLESRNHYVAIYAAGGRGASIASIASFIASKTAPC